MEIRTVIFKYAGTENEIWSDIARCQARVPKIEYSGRWEGVRDDPVLVRITAEVPAIQRFLDFACVCPDCIIEDSHA